MNQLKLVLTDRMIYSILAQTISPDRIELIRVAQFFIVYVNATQAETDLIVALIHEPDRATIISEDIEKTEISFKKGA